MKNSKHTSAPEPCGRSKKIQLTIAVAANLLLLICCKYADFLVSIFNSLTGLGIPLPGIPLPLGVSFFTFLGISYVVDVYRDPDSGSKNFMEVLLYISFFPRLISGPLVRYADVHDLLRSRAHSASLDVYGISRFIIGLSKKVLISATAASIADSVFEMATPLISASADPVSTVSSTSVSFALLDFRLAWLSAFCYMLQIYFDFSGYSDMAIGLSALFGFRTAENFNYPYSAFSIRDFWRRWHISLSAWFRDYLYIPLGGSRKGKGRALLNRMIVFLCTGIWHGANWTFIVWGICHGLLSNLEDLGVIPVEKWKKTLAGRLLCRGYVLLSVMLLFVIFRADSLSQAWCVLRSMFSFAVTDREATALLLIRLLTPTAVFILLLGVLMSGKIGKKFAGVLLLHCDCADSSGNSDILPDSSPISFDIPAFIILRAILLLTLFVLCLMSISRGGFAPFIYFQF